MSSTVNVTDLMAFFLGFDVDDMEDEDEDDPEIKNDPLYGLDLQVF